MCLLVQSGVQRYPRRDVGGGLPYHGPLGGRSVWLSICSRDRVLLAGVVWGEHLARSSMSVCYLGGWVLLALG